MYILMHIYIIFLRIIYFFLKLLPVKNRIVFLSRQSDKLSLDFEMLKDEIRKKNSNVEIVFVTKKIEKSSKAVLKGLTSVLKSMHYLATSKVCITDGYNIAISVLNHKKTLKVFQIWHSLGAIKKFGYQSLNTLKDKKVAKVMHMHENYDYVNGCSGEMIPYFAKAFNCNKNKLYELGLPRIDYLIKNEKILKKQIYNSYPGLRRKKVVLYAPTFRNEDNYKIEKLINEINLDKYALIVKAHPNMNIKVPDNKNVYTCSDFKAMSLIPVADYVITDYSAISIEASILEKPVYIYAYDLEEYKKHPGLNLDLEKELPGYVFKNSKRLYNSLNKDKYDLDVIKKFKDKYVVSTNGDVTSKLADFVLKEGVYNEKN